MKNIMKLLGVFTIVLIVLSGCGPAAHIEQADNVNFNNYRSFAWVEKKRHERTDLLEQKVKQSVTRELEMRGYKQSSNPDVLLSFDMSVERGTRMESGGMYGMSPWGWGWGPRYFGWGPGWGSYPVSVKEGTIGITMFDAKSNKPLLQAWATDEINYRNFTSKEVNRIVQSIFKKWDEQNRYASRYNKHDRQPMTRDYDRY